MAERIQLKDPGSELALHIAKIGTETVEGSEYLLFSNNHTELLVPKSSVLGQLERLGMDTYTAIVGKTIRFSRSTKLSKYGKPYWNLDLASGAEAPLQSAGGEMGKPTTGTPSAAPSAEPLPDTDDAKKLARGVYATRMKQATKYVIDEIEPILKTKGIGMSDDGVYKFAFSLWTEWSHRGIIQ